MNSFKRCSAAGLLFLCFAAHNASAVLISAVPVTPTVDLGSQATVDIVVSDLGGTLIGTYDFNVVWDPAILTFADIAFDIFLDAPLSLQDFDVSAGMVNVAELSLSQSLGNQDGSTGFRLFSLTFDTLDIGTTSLDLIGNIAPDGLFLGNQFGQPILDVDTTSGSLDVVAAVPEPPMLMLLGVGVLALAGAVSGRRGR